MPQLPLHNPEEGQAISPLFLEEVSGHIAASLGLHYPPKRWGDLKRALLSLAGEYGFRDIEESFREMFSAPLSPRQIEALTSHLTVGETYFFRDKDVFEALERNVLPELIARHQHDRRLKIWSAGCSTGEEPYSLAILLTRLIPDLSAWNILLLATDVNVKSLKKAAQGVYGAWSFRQTPSWVREKYFDQVGKGNYKIHAGIKKMISFSYLNLVEDTYPSVINQTEALDMILCRNALMYLTPEAVRKCIEKFYNSLLPDGWFLVSASEGYYLADSGFAAVGFPQAILYKKLASKPERFVFPQEYSEFFPSPWPEVAAEAPPDIAASPPVSPENLVSETKAHEPPPDGYAEALSLYERGRNQEARALLSALLAEKQNDPKVMLLLARLLANSGELDQAEVWCRKALELDRLNPGGYYLLATILQEARAYDQALQTLRTLIYLDDEFVLGHFALGNLARQMGREKESSRHFQNALALLDNYGPEEVLPEGEGLTARRLKEIIAALPAQGGGR